MRKLLPLLCICFFLANVSFSQTTTLIDPAGDGGFQSGTDFASNGWTVLNGTATNKWFVGTVPTLFTTRSAFISNSATGTTHNFDIASGSMVIFYRDVVLPAGQTNITMGYQWYAQGETSYDFLQVAVGSPSITPVVNANIVGLLTITNPLIAGTTVIGAHQLQGTVQTASNLCVPQTIANNATSANTIRIFFIWRNDGSGGTQPPVAIDNISLISSTPTAPAAQPTGLTLTTISTSQVDGSFTAAAGSPNYLVVRYPAGATPTAPVAGTTYTVGMSLGLGTVVSSGTTTTFNATGLLGNTSYDFYVYSFLTSTCPGNVYLTSTPLQGAQATSACAGLAGGTYTIGSGGAYPTLTAAVAATASGILGPVVFELLPTYSSASETFPIVFASNACVTSTNTITVRPQTGATGLVITSSNAGPTIDFNGADYITFDGRPGGTGTASQLSVINTNASGVTFRMNNDASFNTLTYLDLQGQNTSAAPTATAAAGVVYIGGGAATAPTGNDNNTISYCSIHGTSAGTPTIGIAVIGLTSSVPAYNDNGSIVYNNIYDYFNATSASAGVRLDAGTNAWTLSNNSFYQTATRAYTTAAITHRAIWVTPNTGTISNTASGFTIHDNFIGGTAPLAGGTPYTMTATVTALFFGMDISTGVGTATSIQGNVITNMSFTSTSTSTTAFVGINVANGNNNIGTVTANRIGSLTATNNITVATGSASTTSGIRVGGGATNVITNNIVAGITVGSATISNNFVGINVVGGTTNTITNNRVGSSDVVNSINTSTSNTATAQSITGIVVSSGTTSTVSGNIITNMNNNVTGTGTSLTRGIAVSSSASSITNNSITNLSSSTPQAGSGASSAVLGIAMTSTNALGCNVTGNVIDSLVLTTTNATAAVKVTGIFYSGTTSVTSLINRNFIHSFDFVTPNTALVFTGIDFAVGNATLANNMIRLGIKPNGSDNQNETTIRGISSNSTGTVNIYFNSIYIGGQNVGGASVNSFAFTRTSTSGTYDIRNNILSNVRSNAGVGGKHYATFFTTNMTGVTINYNLYQFGGSGGKFSFNGTADVDVYSTGWVASDLNSLVANPQFVNATGSVTAVDLHINTTVGTPVEAAGENIAAITEDYDGQTRSTLTPTDLGADAGNFIAADLSGPSIGYTALSSRTICTNAPIITATITDASGVNTAAGTKPRLWFKKSTENDALPSANNSTGNGWKFVEASNSSSPFTFTFDYSLLTSAITPGDSISYFITAQDLTSTPNVGANIAIFNSVPTSVALSAGVFPITGAVRGFLLLNVPTPITLATNRNEICNSGAVILNVESTVEVPGASYQWQSKPYNSSTFTNISGATTLPYTTAVLTDTTDFRLLVACNGNAVSSSPSIPLTVYINNPSILSTTPGTRCGTGTVILDAVANGSANVNWYANPTGGTPIGTGSSFTTPVISATSTFYAAANLGGSTTNVGRTTPAAATNLLASPRGISFNATQAFTLNSVTIFSTSSTAGAGVVTLLDAAGNTIGAPVNVTWPGGGTATVPVPNILSLNLSVPIGNGYRLLMTTFSTGGISYEFSGISAATFTALSTSVITFNGSMTSLTSTPSTTTYYYFYDWQISTGCEGPRVPVVATVSSPTAISVAADLRTICDGGTANLTATSTNNSYVYTWNPGGISGNTISVSPAQTTKYYVEALDAGTSCATIDSITIRVQPNITNITATPPSFCGAGGSATLNLVPTTGYANNSIQWQYSPNNVTFTDIVGADTSRYITPTIAATTYYRAIAKNSAGTTCSTFDYILEVNNPQILTSTPATRCGVGTVTLAATADAGATVNWFSTPTGGTPIATGNSFTTPSLSATTTYYAAASQGGSTSFVGRLTPQAGAATNLTTYGQDFTLTESITLNTVDVISTTGTSITISLFSAGGATQLQTTGPVAVTPNSTQAINLNWIIPPGTYRLMANGMTGNFIRENSTVVYPITLGTVGQINGFVTSTTSTISTTASYYFMYNWQITTGCTGTRTPVVATVTSPTSITRSATPASICEGQSSTLAANSTNTNYTYQWQPVGVTGASISVSPSSTTKYYVTATDAGTGCTALDSVIVTVNPNPTPVSITPSTTTHCAAVDPAVTLTAVGGTIGNTTAVGTGNIQNTTTSTTQMPPYGNYYTANKHQILVLASELSAAGILPGSSISNLAFDVVSNTNALGYKDFVIKVGHTTATALTTAFLPSPSATVFNQSLFNPNTGWSNHPFSTPFVWNGTSNLLIETYFSNCGITSASSCSGTTCTGWGSGVTYTNNAVVNNTTTPFVSHIFYYADGDGCSPETQTTALATTSDRPNIQFTFSIPTNIVWSPVTELFTNAAATTAYTGTPATVVYAKPTVNRTYTVTATTNANCSVNNTVSITADCSLPVTLTNFIGERRGNVHVLSWTTAAEVNNAGFELQRSADGISFSKLTFIASKATAGNSSSSLSYQFTDANVLVGNNYYRLKQLDKDGKATYSSIVLLRVNKAGFAEIVSVYPNPVKNELSIKVIAPTNDKVNLIVTDISGRMVAQGNYSIVNGDNILKLPMANLTQGTYMLKMICDNGCESKVFKVVKE